MPRKPFKLPIGDILAHLGRNIVATCNLGITLDLKTIAMHARNAEYNPKVRSRLPGRGFSQL